MKYYLETYGCQMNFAESASLENELKKKGWTPTDIPQEASAVILNTCSVRQSAEERVWGRLGYLKSFTEKQPATLILTGCLADHYGETIRQRFPFVDVIAGNKEKADLARMISEINQNRNEIDLKESFFRFSDDHSVPGDFKAFVPIMHGCNNFCTYCIVPYVRGREVSRNPSEIIDEIKRLTDRGVREITLLGQNVNSYRWNERSFSWLLEKICSSTAVEWLRFVSSHPKDLSESVIDQICRFPSICRSLHLPVQHGSDRILKAMNRGYTSQDYRRLTDRIRNRIPDIALTTDILIGFPGEEEEDFAETMNLIKEIKFEDAFTYFFNPRVGTKAAEMDHQLPEEVKKDRLKKIINLQRSVSAAVRRRSIGQTVTVLAESLSKKNKSEILGRTEKNSMVVFSGSENLLGSFVKIKLNSVSGTTYRGEIQ